jgi:hypothetical protein
MSQLTYGNMINAFAGLLADSGPHDIRTYNIGEAIDVGLGVVKYTGVDEKARLPKINQSVITDDAGTYTAGSIVGDVTIDGVTTVVTTVYDTDKDTTLTNFAADILALTGIDTSIYDNVGHTITVNSLNNAISITVDISGITGTMTISSIVASTTDVAADFQGVSVHTHTLSETNYVYPANSPINILRKGRIYVIAEVAVDADDPVFYRVEVGATPATEIVGGFRNDSDGGQAIELTFAKWVRGADAAGFAVLEINLP